VRTCPDTVTGQVLEGDRFRKGRWRFNVHGRPLGAHVKQHSSAVSPLITHSHISHFAGFSEARVLDERRLHLPLLHAPATLEQPAFSAFCRNISCSPRVLGRKHATSRRVTKWGLPFCCEPPSGCSLFKRREGGGRNPCDGTSTTSCTSAGVLLAAPQTEAVVRSGDMSPKI
jgi:hypothetical protein